jgi:hypothetical protein
MPLLYGVGLITALATRDHVRVGDMAAGTLLVYERPDVVLPELAVPEAPGERTLRSSDTEIITDLLLRWPHLDSEARQSLATAVLSRHGVAVATPTDAWLRAQLERLLRGTPP